MRRAAYAAYKRSPASISPKIEPTSERRKHRGVFGGTSCGSDIIAKYLKVLRNGFLLSFLRRNASGTQRRPATFSNSVNLTVRKSSTACIPSGQSSESTWITICWYVFGSQHFSCACTGGSLDFGQFQMGRGPSPGLLHQDRPR